METNEVVSIIIPIYNVEAYLRQCLETVIHQTYPHLEIILVNDGSPDQSEEICKDFFRKDARIRYVRQENGGLSAARNTGIELATGDYLTFIDPDDWVTEDYVEVLYRQLKKYDADVSVANYNLYDDSSSKYLITPLMQRAAPSPGSAKTKGTSAFFICSAFFAQARDALTRPANGFCAPMSRVPMIPSSFMPLSSWRHASRSSASFLPAPSGRTETLTIRRLELRSAPFAWPASSSIPTGTQTP